MVRSTLALSLLAATSAALTGDRPVLNHSNLVPGAYIVEFEEGASATEFRSQAEPAYETRMTFDYELFKGVSIQLDDVDTAEERTAQLASLPAVRNIWPVKMIERPQPVAKNGDRAGRLTNDARDPSQRLDRTILHRRQQGGNETSPYPPHAMTGIDKLHAEGITGEGVTIAVIDTGIDYHHPSLGGCFGEGCLVAYGYDLVGDDYDGVTVFPDDDPDDTCGGHGTHVAGIIAAQGENPEGFTGAAPGVTLAAYRVFGCFGGSSNEVLISAFNMAYEQGADIITASIGGESGWKEDPWTVAVSRIVEKGVPCTLAAGNSGGAGLFFSSAAADGTGVTAIASFDNPLVIERWFEAFYSVDEGGSVAIPWDLSYPTNLDGVEREVWASSLDVDNTRDACDPLPDDTPDLRDYYILFRESEECFVDEQAANLAAKGARFLVRYSFDDLLFPYDVEGYEGTENIIGTAAIEREAGKNMIEAILAGSTVWATFEYFADAGAFVRREWNTVNPGAVSTFTSWGPTFEMDFKPQFGAPGGDIFSTYPVEAGSYAVLSGTSMATPFAAAAYALVSQARGIKPEPQLLETLFTSTAKPQLWSLSGPFEDRLAPAAQQGAGLMQVYDAAFSSARLEPSSLSFNDTANFAETMNFTIANDGTEDVIFNISHVASYTLYTLMEDEETNPGLDGERLSQGAELSFSGTKVTVGAGSTATIEVTAVAPEGLNEKRYPYWSGFITVNGTDGSALSIPYQGVSGSLYEANVMPEAYVADSADLDLNPIPTHKSFELPPPGEIPDLSDPNVSIPVISITMMWGTKHLSVHVVPGDSTSETLSDIESIGEVSIFPLLLWPAFGWTLAWFGELNDGGYVPAGSYKLVFAAQRLFSDGTEDEDWIIRTTVPFNLSYPSTTARRSVRD